MIVSLRSIWEVHAGFEFVNEFESIILLQAMYFFLHTVTGVPWTAMISQGKESSLTHWDQIDYGEQFTDSKKFITVIPIALWVSPAAF